MKFGKRLASQMEETLPEWRDKFLSYKQLKKRLKLISAPDCFTQAAFESGGTSPVREESGTSAVDVAVDELKRSGGAAVAAIKSEGLEHAEEQPQQQQQQQQEESEFTSLLEVELDKFNTFFMEKEEEYVIRLQELKDRIEKLKSKPDVTGLDLEQHEELIQIRKDIVTFHGEMVLLFNYSSLNYTGLVKILKKYDKRTGMSLRLPFIQGVLQQPFFTTELLSKLVEECERNLQSIFPADELAAITKAPEQPELTTDAEECDPEQVEGIYRSTMAALQTIKDLRKGSSTYSALSLPPLGNSDS
ncbi:SPX domain-containing protein 1 [Selaginella moellendorffii]|uniref:SPX domain-containing protein 1 n=1 Tax=Selaginella moellendorffii TaxID=88036 RepID=UPI000D1D08D3|nr:SPX domain-containing protein 1 [Selaginella moellendorffii]|eukprot:XP_024515651.1 SPX domain-containing protein 1 [Selaginella moellendorffii]